MSLGVPDTIATPPTAAPGEALPTLGATPPPDIDINTGGAPAEPVADADAAPTAEGPPPATKAKPASKPESDLGQNAIAIRARERRTKEDRAALADERRSFDAQRAELQSRADLGIQVAQLAQKDPIKLLTNLGFTRDQIAERLMNDGKPGLHELEARRDERIARIEQRLEHEAQEKGRAGQAEASQKELAKFVSMARDGERKWPLASKYGEQKLIRMGDRIADEHIAKGTRLTYAQVIDKIEAELSEIAGLTGRPAKAAPRVRDVLKATDEELLADTLAEIDASRGDPEPTSEVDVLMMSEDELLEHTKRAIAAATGKERRRSPVRFDSRAKR